MMAPGWGWRWRPGAAGWVTGYSRGDRPLDVQRALDWLRQCEKHAGLDSIPGGGFHCLRRKWACEKKGLSDTDAAAAGGWVRVDTMTSVYQVADDAGMEAVVLNPKRLGRVG